MTEVLRNVESRLKDDILTELGGAKGEYICTIHRQENADDRRNMEEIVKAIVDPGYVRHPASSENAQEPYWLENDRPFGRF